MVTLKLSCSAGSDKEFKQMQNKEKLEYTRHITL